MDDKLWGGRFESDMEPALRSFNRSFNFDSRLLSSDLTGTAAHAWALRQSAVLNELELRKILDAIESIREQASRNPGLLNDYEGEDVHSFIECQLILRLGELGRKIQTGRSRNDQVATAMRIWLLNELKPLKHSVLAMQSELLNLAEKHFEVIIPGYTHLQRAQPILFAHWCLAYFEMFKRDFERLESVRKATSTLPLGSGALAGTNYPGDRTLLAERLGFDSASLNSLDAVSDRDYLVDFLSSASLIMVHLSRLAEDLIIYSTQEFGIIELEDRVGSGSSLMPQKKNPDVAELIRGKTGRVFGDLFGLLTVLKGLPLAYNKDLQEDKEAVFDALDTAHGSIVAMTHFLRGVRLNLSRIADHGPHGYLNATELADYLVSKGIAFRSAHEIAGKIVRRALEMELPLESLPLAEMQQFASCIDNSVFESLKISEALTKKSAMGGTSPSRVKQAVMDSRTYVTAHRVE